MIENLFINILNMSLTASLVIVAVLLVRLILRKAPKIFSYALWFIVLFRLLCPASFSSAFSLVGVLQSGLQEQGFELSLGVEVDNTLQNNIGNMGEGNASSNSNVVPEEVVSDSANISTGLSQSVDNVTDSLVTGTAGVVNAETEINNNVTTGTTTTILEKVFSIGAIIWLAGVIVLIAYSLITLISLRKKIKSAENEKDNIYISEGIDTPFVYGVIRPRIYLPSILNDKEREYILVHEQIHIKRFDHIVKIVAFGALCLHWFNPLVWVAFLLMGKDMEMSCDEAVIRKIGSDVKKDYSSSLLALASERKIIGGTPLAFGEGDTGSRIKNVLSYKKPTIWVICIAVVICVVLGVFLTANPSGNDSEKAKGESESYIDESESDEVSTEEEMTEAVIEETTKPANIRSLNDYEFKKEVDDWTYQVNIYNFYREDRRMDVLVRINLDDIIRRFYTTLEFTEDCTFNVSYVRSPEFEPVYSEVSFDTFADVVEDFELKNCTIVVEDNKIVRAYLRNAYGGNSVIEAIDDPKEKELVNVEVTLREYYEWMYTKECDIADCSGIEKIEVYNGDEGEGDFAMFVIRDENGDIIYYDTMRRFDLPFGYSNIYLGEIDGVSYIFRLYKEERYDNAQFVYHIYRVDENGESVSYTDSMIDYNPLEKDNEYYSWEEEMNSYFENCEFILGTGYDRLWFTENIAKEYTPADYY